MQLETISDTVHRLILPDQEIILVDTAHVSQNSMEEVNNIIATIVVIKTCVKMYLS